MSINSQILATMESEGILNEEALDMPELASGPYVKVNTNNPVASLDTPITDELKKRLLSPSVTYSAIKNGVETVNNMEDVHGAIATKGAISFADAEEVAMTFESFGSKVSLREFTKTPSKINFSFTQRFMEQEIRVRQENVATASEAFFDGQIEDSEAAFEDYRGFYGQTLIEDVQAFRVICKDWLTNLKSIPSQIFQVGSDFLNIATIPCEDFPFDFTGPGNIEAFKDAVKNLKDMLENNIHLKSLMYVVANKGSFEEYANPNKMSQALVQNPCLVDFIKMFNDPYLEQFIRNMERDAENALNELRELQASKDFNPTDFNALRDFVVENGSKIDDSNTMVHYYIEAIEMIQKVYLNTTMVVEYFTLEN